MMDTPTAAQALQDAGVEESQARAHVQVVAQIVRDTRGDLATKADVARLESEMRTVQWMVGFGFGILALTTTLLFFKVA